MSLSCKHRELAGILRNCYQGAPRGDKTLAVQLFAIRYADQLEGVSKTELSGEALNGKNYVATINDAVKLAKHVRIIENHFR